MNKLLKRSLIGVVIAMTIMLALLAFHFLIGLSVKSNIQLVQEKYGGTAEEALIAFLQDENNSATDRSHIAVWTLAQIESDKALPALYQYYKNDPQGNICYGKHHAELCQYEIYKAIKAIEKKNTFTHVKLKEATNP
jgi:hypothetical protein